MIAENHGQAVLPGLAEARLTETQVRFCQLMAIGFDEEGKKLNQGDCAIKAGMGNSAASSKALASRYMKDPRFKTMIQQLRTEALGDLKLHNNEIIQGLRDIAAISLGKQSVKRTVFDKEVTNDDSTESVAKTFSVYEPDLGQAHQAFKTMGTITGLIDSGSKSASSGSGRDSGGAQDRELNGVERTARVFELLKRSGALGTGQTVDRADGDLGPAAGASDSSV